MAVQQKLTYYFKLLLKTN